MNNKGIKENYNETANYSREYYIEIMKNYRSGDENLKKEAINKMVSSLSNYVYSIIVNRFPTYVKMRDDLYQEGILAILKKLDAYNPEIAAPTTFFQIYIVSDMNSFIIGETHHTSNHYGNNIIKVKKAINDFEKSNTEYNNADIAKYLNIPLETVIACRKIINYSQEVSFDADEIVKSSTPSSELSPEDKLIRRERLRTLYKAISELDEIKKYIVVHKLDLTGEKMSYKTIAKELCISIDRSRKLYQEALREIKNKISVKKYFGNNFLTKEELMLEEAEISFAENEEMQQLLEGLEEIELDMSGVF